jgi:hypothetical protein
MFLLGLISIIQITFLPGLILLKFFKAKHGILQSLVYAFALSLISNHLLVFTITALRINISIAFYVIFVLEIVGFIVLYKDELRQPLTTTLTNKREEFIVDLSSFWTSHAQKSSSSYQIIVEIIALVSILWAGSSIWWAFRVWLSNVDTVFIQWDAIVSWNRWAIEWFNGSFPSLTNRYAQLIPTNFAVTYAYLGGTQLQFFAKSIMPFFNLFILLLLFSLGLKTKNFGYFVSVIITRYTMKKFLGDYIASGYVDVALAFFTFITIYTLIKAQHGQSIKEKIAYIYLGAIFAGGTALTKQNGLIVFATYPILTYLIVVNKISALSNREKLSIVFKPMLLALCLILPWYIFNEYHIFAGTNITNVEYLVGGRHEGRTIIERFLRAMGLLEKYAWLYILIIAMLPFLGSPFLWIGLILFLPYSIIWAVAFSTFPRNLSIAFPLLGLLAGMSVKEVLTFSKSIINRIMSDRLQISIIVIILCIGILTGSLLVPNSVLINHQINQQKEILLPTINHQLYDYFEQIGHFEPIMTNYPIQYLPGLENYQIPVGNFSDYNFYRWTITNHLESSLILVFEDRADEKVLQEISEAVEAGLFEIIFEEGKYSLIRIRR